MKQVPGEMVREVGSGIYSFFKAEHDVVQSFVSDPTKATRDTQAGALEYNRRWQCFDWRYRVAFSCRLYGGTLNAAMMAELAKSTPEVLATTKTAVARAADSVASVAGMSGAERRVFVQSQMGKQFTTLTQRRAYVEAAMKTAPDGHTIFLDVQNSSMKILNDTLGDKNLVTALTNRRLQMTFSRLQDLKKTYPNVEMLTYDDFKSGRVAFRAKSGELPKGFEAAVKSMVEKTNRDFAAEVENRKLVPDGAKIPPPDKWFTAGLGATGDQANAAARYARRSVEGNELRNFAEPRIQQNLQMGLRNTERLRAGLAQSSLKNTTLLEKGADGKVIPSMDVFESYRKTSGASDFAKSLQDRSGVPVSAQQAQALRTYIDSINELTPSIHIVEERQVVSFTGSKANGVMVDVTSMGALNLSQEAQALARSQSVADAVVKSREGEQKATTIFSVNKEAIVRAGEDALKTSGANVKVLVSGDDILFQPSRQLTNQELERLHAAIAQSSSSANVRLSAVSSGVKNANLVGVRGELLEKKTRSLTMQSVPDQQKYTLMVVSDKNGAPKLKVAARDGAPTDPAVEASYQEAFSKALTSK